MLYNNGLVLTIKWLPDFLWWWKLNNFSSVCAITKRQLNLNETLKKHVTNFVTSGDPEYITASI